MITRDATGLITMSVTPRVANGPANIQFGVKEDGGAAGDELYRLQHDTGVETVDYLFDAAEADDVAAAYAWHKNRRWDDGTKTFELLEFDQTGFNTLDRVHVLNLLQDDLAMVGVFGTPAGAQPAILPERYARDNGYASFHGRAVGYYQHDNARLYRMNGFLGLSANFQLNLVEGLITSDTLEAIDPVPPGGGRFISGCGLCTSFEFDAVLNSAAMTFQGTAESVASATTKLTGTVDGMFYGASGEAADEVGLNFSLANDLVGIRLFGVAAGAHVLAPRPYLTPMTTVLAGQGPSIMMKATGVGIFGTRGAGSAITSAYLSNTNPNITGSFYPDATSRYQDDRFSFNYNANGFAINEHWMFSSDPNSSNGFGTVYLYRQPNGTALYEFEHHNIGFDLGPSLAGALDNVFLVSIAGSYMSANQDRGFLVFGTQTAAADMPTSGSATFEGVSKGYYLDAAGRLYLTDSKLEMNANFGTGAVSGQATDFRSRGDYFGSSTFDALDFDFAGSIASGTSTFSAAATSQAGGVGLTGRVEGAFYGAPGVAPDEVGLAYQLGTPGSGSMMAGAGLLVKD
ncbi:MAG: hypothetical protein EON61_10110 [Alphaproteobacteria bacterium]|nr:MAG: hypothetical protein EON61_10110 [Alphaproteobacteria bacterium]